MKRLSYIGIAVFILSSFQVTAISTAQGQLNCTDVAAGCLKINLPALKTLIPTSEIVLPQEALQQVSHGEISKSSLPNLTGKDPVINKEITHEIQNLWQLKVPKNSILEPSNANYTCADNNLTLDPNTVIPVTDIESTSITRTYYDENHELAEGSAKFKFTIPNNLKPGNYICNLHIKVTVTPPQEQS